MKEVISKINHEGARERLSREGVHALSDVELLALIFGTGTRGESVSLFATRFLKEVGGLQGLEQLGLGALASYPGLGQGKASRLLASLELGKRIAARPLFRGKALSSSLEVFQAFASKLGHYDVEHFYAIALDARHRPLRELCIARGSINSCPVLPADVFRAVLRESASAVIFLHNHPSGDPTPSPEDIDLTDRLRMAGNLLGIQTLDHIIIAKENYFSFSDAGYFVENA